MSEYFKFGGTDSRLYDVEVFGKQTYNATGRAYNVQTIPGRSGDMLVDEKRFPNVNHSYGCIIHENFNNNLLGIRSALLSKRGYQRLEDSIHTDEFYLAYFAEDFVPRIDERRTMGKFTLTFVRKPQRFLKAGETVVSLTRSGTITNPTLFESKPLLRIYGEGVVGIGDNAVTVISSDGYVDVDCEIMEAYKGTLSFNSSVTVQNNDFPTIAPGSVGITLGSGITRVDITPRWYRL